ncbi:hypothetical protein E2562_033599 [Oryza meyeriana var. granulata]|uniref:Uncharacterized protein n=1 Tax=Oryza meyeriana var. granulata TaxID=110450 RepID=A0A6G1DAX1_9ORYZ|nr:hypothetical protein E2562_033599 [Oryza meyeriana var. granulata]
MDHHCADAAELHLHHRTVPPRDGLEVPVRQAAELEEVAQHRQLPRGPRREGTRNSHHPPGSASPIGSWTASSPPPAPASPPPSSAASSGSSSCPATSPRARVHPDSALCSDRGKDAGAELVRVFVSTVVAAYLDRTAVVCTSDQLLAGLTDPKQEAMVKDLLVSVCNGAVETFVRTTRQVAKEASSVARIKAVVVVSELQTSGPCCVMDRVSSTLTVPRAYLCG